MKKDMPSMTPGLDMPSVTPGLEKDMSSVTPRLNGCSSVPLVVGLTAAATSITFILLMLVFCGLTTAVIFKMKKTTHRVSYTLLYNV